MELTPELRAKLEQRLGSKLYPAEEKALELAAGSQPAELTTVEAELIVQLASKLGEPWLDRPWRYREKARDELAGRGTPFERWKFHLAGFVMLGTVVAFNGGIFEPVRLMADLAPWAGYCILHCVIALTATRERHRMLQIVEVALPQSNILERLGDNDPALLDIQQAAPAPFRWFLTSRFGSGRAAKLDLVVRHLDWYLQPPRPLFRWSWVAQLGAGLLGAAAMLALNFLGGGPAPTPNWWGIPFLIALSVWSGMRAVDLRLYFTDYLLGEIVNRVRSRQAITAAAETAGIECTGEPVLEGQREPSPAGAG